MYKSPKGTTQQGTTQDWFLVQSSFSHTVFINSLAWSWVLTLGHHTGVTCNSCTCPTSPPSARNGQISALVINIVLWHHSIADSALEHQCRERTSTKCDSIVNERKHKTWTSFSGSQVKQNIYVSIFVDYNSPQNSVHYNFYAFLHLKRKTLVAELRARFGRDKAVLYSWFCWVRINLRKCFN